jgi:hypothetical protein
MTAPALIAAKQMLNALRPPSVVSGDFLARRFLALEQNEVHDLTEPCPQREKTRN